MRLNKVANGHSWSQKALMRLMGLVAGAPTPDVIRTLKYRSSFFGRPYSDWLHEVMRGPSAWSVGERELFAAFTSRKNECQFCTIGHAAASAKALEDTSLVQAALDGRRHPALNPKLRAVLDLLEKLTLEPDAITTDDVERILATGVSHKAIEEAIHICALFNIINRLADALDFDTSSSSQPDTVARAANAMLRFGYKI